MNCTRNQTVNVVLFQHQGTENHVVFQLFAGNGFGHTFVFTQFDQASNVAFANNIWINDFYASAQLNALRGRNAGDLIRVAQQYAGCDTAFSTDSRRFNGTRLVTFRQNNALAGFTCQLGQLITERWRRQTTAALRGRGQGFNPVSVDVVSNVFLNFLNTFVIVNRNFQVEALQAQRGLPGVGVHHEYRQAGFKCTFAQFSDTRVHFVAASQQQGTDFHAVHGCQACCNQHVRTIGGSHQQRTCSEVLQHVRNAACAESHRLHATGIDITFVNDSGVQMTRHIDCTRCDQIEAPWHRAQNRQRAGFLQFSRINFDHFCFGRVVENLGQIRASTALLINRCVQFVNDYAGDVGVFHTAEAAASQFNTLVQLFRGIGTLRHYEDDFCVQRFRDFVVQRLRELMFTGWDQAFNQYNFSVFSVRVVVRDDLFHQHIFLIAGQQRFNVAHLQRLSGWQRRVSTDDAGSLVWRIATGTRLRDRLEDAQTNAFAFHCADHAKADAGQTDAGSGRDQHNNTGHGLSSFVTADLAGYKTAPPAELAV